MCVNFVAAGTRHAKACPVMLGPICATLESLTATSRAALSIFFIRSWRRRTSSPSAAGNRKSSPQKVPLDPPPNVPPICPLHLRLLPANGLKCQTVPVFCAGRSLRIVKAWPATRAPTCVRSECLTCWGKALQLTPSRNWSAVACYKPYTPPKQTVQLAHLQHRLQPQTNREPRFLPHHSP